VTGRARAVLLVALAALAATLAAPAAAQEPAAPTLELVSRPPWARPDDLLQLGVTTTGDPAATSVQVEVFSALDSVEELEESATEDVGVRLSRTPPTPVASLPVGSDGARLVPLRVAAEPADDLTTQIVEPGVHPVVVSLLGPGGEVLDEVRTPLVRLGDEREGWAVPDLAVLLDVDASPTLRPDGTRSIGDGDLDRIGAAAALVAAHPDLGLSVAAVPDTVDALAASDDPRAAAALEDLAGADVLAAPYVRTPVASLLAEGLEGLLPPLLARGTNLLADRLGADPRDGVWVATHPPGADGAGLLAGLGVDRVVVPAPAGDGDDDEEDDDDGPAPLADAGPRPLAGTDAVLAVVADEDLASELARPLGDDADAAHVALARHLLRPTDPDPGADPDDDEPEPATVLVHARDLAPRSTLAGLLALLDDPEAPVRVGGLDLVDVGPDLPADPDDDPLVEPVAWDAPAAPDLDAVGPRLLDLAGRLDSFEAMLAGRSPRVDDLRLQVATALAEGAGDAERDAAVGAVEAALARSFDGIVLSGQTDLNLTSRRGTLPVTVENRNDFAVDVLVRVRSDRLAFPDGDVLPVTVGEQDLLRIDVPVEARATGSVPVFVDVLSVDGAVPLDTRRLNVRSTAVSGVGLVLSLGAVVVLGTWWIRHTRATRRERAASGTAGEPVE